MFQGEIQFKENKGIDSSVVRGPFLTQLCSVQSLVPLLYEFRQSSLVHVQAILSPMCARLHSYVSWVSQRFTFAGVQNIYL